MKNFGHLFQKYETIKVEYQDTLFPMDWKMLLQKRCPICMCKLSEKRGILLCKSHKHPKPFIIKLSTYDTLCKKMNMGV